MDPETVKSLVPVLTFALGIAFTLAFKTYENGRDTTRNSVKEIVRLAREWHNQVHQIAMNQNGNKGRRNGNFDTLLLDYIRNRLLLPDFLLHLGIIRERKSCRSLVPSVEKFLELVTDYDLETNSHETGLRCRNIFEELEDPMQNLDRALQEIVNQSIPVLR